MYRQYSLLLVFPLLMTFGFLYLHFDGENPDDGEDDHQLSINKVIGDESFIKTYGAKPAEDVPERIRIKTHLQYVEKLLRNRSVDHLSDELKQNRIKYLNHLRDYILAGKFPQNDDYRDTRRPTFISKNGNICAVGYLIEQDLGPKAVESINTEFKYEYISEINDPDFLKWVESSGFTLRELAMIQPAYAPDPKPIFKNENHIDLSYSIGSSLLIGSNALYMMNRSENPWLFEQPSSAHWFGLASGGGLVLLGALNLEKKRTYIEPPDYETSCYSMNCAPTRVKITNRARTALSLANMGVGLASIIRAGYNLIQKTTENNSSKKATVGVTQLEHNPIETSTLVPAIQMRVRF